MSAMKKINWTKEDIKVYTLIYCANADFFEDDSEVEYIKSMINKSDYNRLHSEYESDNDYQSIQKINNALKYYDFSLKQKQKFFSEIKELFKADGDFDLLEKNMYMNLKRYLF
jgi:hypothetical protein